MTEDTTTPDDSREPEASGSPPKLSPEQVEFMGVMLKFTRSQGAKKPILVAMGRKCGVTYDKPTKTWLPADPFLFGRQFPGELATNAARVSGMQEMFFFLVHQEMAAKKTKAALDA